MNKVKEVLIKINNELKKNNILFGIGGSCLLNFYNLINKPHDIDVVINGSEVNKVKEILDNIGEKEEVEWKSKFKTSDFFAYNVDGIRVEFMADFGVELSNKFVYRLNLSKDNIKEEIIEDSHINYCLLEDWFVAYKAIGDPKKRSKIVEDYFKKNGIERKDILKNYLNEDLTDEIKADIKEILNF